MEFNTYAVKNIELEPNYQLTLLTYYTIINNKLNKMSGDESTLNEVKNMIDDEMKTIVNMLNCKVLTIKE